MTGEEMSVWVKLERPGIKTRSLEVPFSGEENLNSLILLAIQQLPYAAKGIDSSVLCPQDTEGNELEGDLKVTQLPQQLGRSAHLPLRLVCEVPHEGTVLFHLSLAHIIPNFRMNFPILF
jgi:hypothetical protein